MATSARQPSTLQTKLSPGKNTSCPLGSCADSGAGTRPMGAAQGASRPRALKGEWPVYLSSSWKRWDIMEVPGPTPGLIAQDFLLHNTKSHFSSRSSYSQDDSKIHRAKPTLACLPTPLFFNPKQVVLQILDVMNCPGGGSVCSRDTPTSPLVTAPHAGLLGDTASRLPAPGGVLALLGVSV